MPVITTSHLFKAVVRKALAELLVCVPETQPCGVPLSKQFKCYKLPSNLKPQEDRSVKRQFQE